jgi:hypothetical protein
MLHETVAVREAVHGLGAAPVGEFRGGVWGYSGHDRPERARQLPGTDIERLVLL